MQGGEDDGMFKISEIHDTFSESAADSTLRKSLSMGDMDLDGGGGGSPGEGDDDQFAGTQKSKRKGCGEKEEEEDDDEATLRDATDDTSESTLPIIAGGPSPTQSRAGPTSKGDLPAGTAHPPPPQQRPPLVHAATVATPARLRPKLSRQKSFEIDSDSDFDVCGIGKQVKATAALDHERRTTGSDPSETGDASDKMSSTKREDAVTGEGEAQRSSGRAKLDRARLKDKESSGEDPKSGKKSKVLGERSKSGKSRRGSSSGSRGCKRGGDKDGTHSSTLPNPKKHYGRKKRPPGLTITIDNLKESFDGYDKMMKSDADMMQHSPNFCIRSGSLGVSYVTKKISSNACDIYGRQSRTEPDKEQKHPKSNNASQSGVTVSRSAEPSPRLKPGPSPSPSSSSVLPAPPPGSSRSRSKSLAVPPPTTPQRKSPVGGGGGGGCCCKHSPILLQNSSPGSWSGSSSGVVSVVSVSNKNRDLIR